MKNRFLLKVFKFKIIVTIFLWAFPLIIIPSRWFCKFLFIDVGQNAFFIRLLGVAYLALIIGYLAGMSELKKGIFPKKIIYMGIVSNAGASITITIFGLKNSFPFGDCTKAVSCSKELGICYLWLSAIITFLIAATLLFSLISKKRNSSPSGKTQIQGEMR